MLYIDILVKETILSDELLDFYLVNCKMEYRAMQVGWFDFLNQRITGSFRLEKISGDEAV